MADDIVSVRSVQLHELLGAAMAAIVRADGLATQATLEYIQTVGFVGSAQDAGDEAGGQVDGGQLRMASFRYRKLDENNEPAEFIAEVPVLSLVPIPALQVKNAKFSLSIKIDDVTKSGKNQDRVAEPTIREPILTRFSPGATKLLTRPAAVSGSRTEEVRATHHLEIEVTMTQADIPVGMERIFQLMDQAIRDRKAT